MADIKTKLNVGDTIWWVNCSNKVYKGIIKEIVCCDYQGALYCGIYSPSHRRNTNPVVHYSSLKKKVADAPTVDAEIVTRCKDCKHLVAVNVNGKGIPTCRVSGMEVAPDEFCSRGEKGRR